MNADAAISPDEVPRKWTTGSIIGLVIACALFITLAVRQHLFVDHWAVNILFLDQWNIYKPMFENASWWTTFDLQHGPHRQGIGFIITRWVAQASGWNSRADALEVSFVLIFAALAAMALAARCGVPADWRLAAVPLLFFNLRQYESFLGAANVCLTSMPLLLITLFCLSWFIPWLVLRMCTLGVLTFLLIFSGFGLFIGLIAPLVLIVDGYHAIAQRKWKRAGWIGVAIVMIAGAWLVFAHGYLFRPAVPDFRFPWPRPMEYFYFISLMFANTFGVTARVAPSIVFGAIVAGVLLFICVFHGWRIIRSPRGVEAPDAAIFSLAAFELIFTSMTAIGRISIGWNMAPYTSHYLTLLIPAGLAIFLHVSIIPSQTMSLLVTRAALLAGLPIAYFTDSAGITYSVLGGLICAALALACFVYARRGLRPHSLRNPKDLAAFGLSAVGLLFCAIALLGSLIFGLDLLARDVLFFALAVPVTGIILLSDRLNPRLVNSSLMILFIIIQATGASFLRREDWGYIRWFHDGKLKWKEAYLQTHDEEAANRISGTKVFPSSVRDRLDFLEEHRLNLFNPDGKP